MLQSCSRDLLPRVCRTVLRQAERQKGKFTVSHQIFMLSSGVPGRALTDSDTILCRIEDAVAAFIAAGTPNPTNVRGRDYPGGGSLATILPVMWVYLIRLREQSREETIPLPPVLQQLLTSQIALLWPAGP